MHNFLRIGAIIAFVAFAAVEVSPVRPARALTVEELKKSIEERGQDLLRIHLESQAVQKNLAETGEKGKTLNREIRQMDYQMNQLGLQIKSGEIRREKFLLEIQELELTIEENRTSAERKRLAIAELIRDLNEREQMNLLVLMLVKKTIADGVFEAQSLGRTGDELADTVRALDELKRVIDAALRDAEEKHAAVEDENRNLKNRKVIVDDHKREREQLLRDTKNQERRYQEQLKELEKQQAAVAEEIEGIERELRSQLKEPSLPLARPGVLGWPSASKVMSQGYGTTAFALRNYKGKHHNGIDIAGPIGTEIFATAAGRVVTVGNQDAYCPRAAYGKYIVVKHENGLTSLYAHLSRQSVAVGQNVERGEVIGYMGRSGWATGSHLHFTIWGSDTFTMRSTRVCGQMPVGGDLDPTPYLERPASP